MCRPDLPDLDLPDPAGRPGPRFLPDPKPCSASIAASNLARSRFKSANMFCMSIFHLSFCWFDGKIRMADFNRCKPLNPATFRNLYQFRFQTRNNRKSCCDGKAARKSVKLSSPRYTALYGLKERNCQKKTAST